MGTAGREKSSIDYAFAKGYVRTYHAEYISPSKNWPSDAQECIDNKDAGFPKGADALIRPLTGTVLQ